jgi:diphthamide synthase (EF-2-diphthine--ammonia ligase)
VVATRADLMGEEWLGRIIDYQFLEDLENSGKNITPCGEAGEFHSFVIDRPLFQKRIEVVKPKIHRLEHWYYDIRKCVLKRKPRGI